MSGVCVRGFCVFCSQIFTFHMHHANSSALLRIMRDSPAAASTRTLRALCNAFFFFFLFFFLLFLRLAASSYPYQASHCAAGLKSLCAAVWRPRRDDDELCEERLLVATNRSERLAEQRTVWGRP